MLEKIRKASSSSYTKHPVLLLRSVLFLYLKFFNCYFHLLRSRVIIYDELEETDEDADQAAQQDWSLVWNLFDDPHQLLTTPGSLPNGMHDMVRNAVSEMRRYYSRKVVDVLIKVTRTSLDAIRKRFVRDIDPGTLLR